MYLKILTVFELSLLKEMIVDLTQLEVQMLQN